MCVYMMYIYMCVYGIYLCIICQVHVHENIFDLDIMISTQELRTYAYCSVMFKIRL